MCSLRQPGRVLTPNLDSVCSTGKRHACRVKSNSVTPLMSIGCRLYNDLGALLSSLRYFSFSFIQHNSNIQHTSTWCHFACRLLNVKTFACHVAVIRHHSLIFRQAITKYCCLLLLLKVAHEEAYPLLMVEIKQSVKQKLSYVCFPNYFEVYFLISYQVYLYIQVFCRSK